MSENDIRENPLFWAALDDYVHQTWPALRQLLNVLYNHQEELEPQITAILFGGIGKFHMTYDSCRAMGFNEVESFHAAIEAAQSDRRIQELQTQAINHAVDSHTFGLEGME